MAGVDLYSGSSNTGTTSPRISFSHDFCQSDVLVPVESRHHLRSNSSGLSSSIDFDFCVRRESFGQESYAADELFSDGKILPTEIKKKITPMKQTDDHEFGSRPPLPPPRAMREISKQENAMESKGAGRTEVGHDQKQSSKFFWRFTRSTSSCGSGYGRISFCPLPPLLSRSNSTGSAAANLKRAPLSNDAQNSKQNTSTSQKHASIKASQSWASKGYRKPPLKKGHGLYANAVPISPAILNVPTSYLFGFGLFFSSGKDHKSRK